MTSHKEYPNTIFGIEDYVAYHEAKEAGEDMNFNLIDAFSKTSLYQNHLKAKERRQARKKATKHVAQHAMKRT